MGPLWASFVKIEQAAALPCLVSLLVRAEVALAAKW